MKIRQLVPVLANQPRTLCTVVASSAALGDFLSFHQPSIAEEEDFERPVPTKPNFTVRETLTNLLTII